jgi:hypothetical protein
VDPRTILYTGLTRDGTFLVENGRITRAVQNFRFNDSPLFMLNNLEMLGRPVRLGGTEAGGSVVMPAIKVRDFNFTSLSEAVEGQNGSRGSRGCARMPSGTIRSSSHQLTHRVPGGRSFHVPDRSASIREIRGFSSPARPASCSTRPQR